MDTHCQRKTHRLPGPDERLAIPTVPSRHGHRIPRTGLFAHGPHRDRCSGRHDLPPDMERGLDARGRKGAVGVLDAEDAQGEVREPIQERDALRHRAEVRRVRNSLSLRICAC